MRAVLIHALSALMLVATVAFGAAPAFAQKLIDVPEHPERKVVVELFSSQSCGNCPNANANLGVLAKRSDVVALTYPVGLWNYLGWDDTFAKPEFMKRQKSYNRNLGHRGPYTPQIVFGGRFHSSGVNLSDIAEGFAQRDLKPYLTSVSFTKGHVTVSGPTDAKGEVMLVHFRPGVTKMTPGGGANEGKPMKYYNLVTRLEPLGPWSGGEASYAAVCEAGCVALVQRDSSEGRIIGAAVNK
jgi:hypothetical protein